MKNVPHINYLYLKNIRGRDMPFLMSFKPLEMFFFPAIFSACFYTADLWLLRNLPFGNTTLSLFLFAFLIGALAVPVVGFWAIKKNGTFVISADKNGLYYRMLDKKDQYFFISWNAISNFNIKTTNKRTLVIETTFNKFNKDQLPIPCNGDIYFLKSGTICLEFNTSFMYKSNQILKNLKNLKSSNATKATLHLVKS